MTSASLAKDTFYMLSARALYVVATYLVHVLLGRSLGPADYGSFGVVISLSAVIEVSLMRGLRDGVAKFVSENPERRDAVERSGWRLQAAATILLTAAYLAAAPALARLLGDPGLAPAIRLSSGLLPFLSFHNFYAGVLTGRRAFGRRSVLLSAHSWFRFGLVLIVVLLGWDLFGALGAYIGAGAFGVILGRLLTKDGAAATGLFPAGRILRFALPIVLYGGLTVLLMNIDLFLVKRILSPGPAAGFYTAAGMLADIPQQLFVAFSVTVFPAVSAAAASGESDKLRAYVSGGLRGLLLLTLPIAAFISAAAGPVLALAYSRSYAPAAGSLSILIFGITFLTVFHFLTAVISGSGRPRVAALLAAGLIFLDVGLNVFLIKKMGIAGAALATTLTTLTGVVVAGAYVLRTFGILTSGRTFARISAAAVLLFVCPRLFVPPGAWLVPYAAALFGLYLLILIATKELRPAELLAPLGYRRAERPGREP